MLNDYTMYRSDGGGDTYAWLMSQYGPLVPMKALAAILDRSPGGLRQTVSQSPDEPWATLRAGRRRRGRRVYITAAAVARAIDGPLYTKDSS